MPLHKGSMVADQSQCCAPALHGRTSRLTWQHQTLPPLGIVGLQVGIDAAPDPGLRGPTNFHGSLDAATLARLDRALADAQADFGCAHIAVVLPGPPVLRFDNAFASQGYRT